MAIRIVFIFICAILLRDAIKQYITERNICFFGSAVFIGFSIILTTFTVFYDVMNSLI